MSLWETLQAELPDFPGVNDCDRAFSSALWCIASARTTSHIVEVGVARGISARVILESSARRNLPGVLHSIDLPPLTHFGAGVGDTAGIAVSEHLRERWHFVRGPSRRKLQPLLGSPPIDAFVHDGLNTPPSLKFDLEMAWGHLKDKGILLVNGITRSTEFSRFAEQFSPDSYVVADNEGKMTPSSPGQFGMAIKQAPKAPALS